MRKLLILTLLFSSCMVGPKYSPPEVCLPTEFEEEPQTDSNVSNLYHWWTQFNDPLLDELVQEALCANYDLRLAIEKIEETRAQYRIQRSYLWPEIDYNAVATRSRISQDILPVQSLPGGNFLPSFLNLFQTGFDAIWELDFFGKFRRSKQAAYDLFEATQEDAENVMTSLISEVAINYVNIRALQNRIRLIKEKIGTHEAELLIVGGNFAIGLKNEIDVSNLVAVIEADRAELPTLEASLKQTIYALAYLLGREPEGFRERFDSVEEVPSAEDRVPVGLPSDLLRRRPDIRSAERRLAAATEKVGVAIADYFPHIALTGVSLGAGNRSASSIGWETDTFNHLFQSVSRMFSVGLGLNWNLIDFGRVRAEVDVNKSLQRQALLTYEQSVINSLKEVESALVAYFEEGKRKAALEMKVRAETRTLEILFGLNKIGIKNQIEVLEAQKALLNSKSTLVQSEQALAGDLIALYKAIGGAWECPDEPISTCECSERE